MGCDENDAQCIKAQCEFICNRAFEKNAQDVTTKSVANWDHDFVI